MEPFVGKRLSAVTVEDVQRLVDNAVGESLYLEYKRDLPLDRADEKKEFLRDVTAFPNAEGGTIIFGVEEDRDTRLPKAIVGLSITTMDELVQRVENILKDGIDERLPSYEIAAVPFGQDRCVLVMRLPPSIRQPHMVILGGERRFFMRSNTGKQEMSTAQIRDAVLRTDSMNDRLMGFVRGRVTKWRAAGIKGPLWLFHVVPLRREPSAIRLADDAVARRVLAMRWPMGSSNFGHCLDGYKVHFQNDRIELTQRIVFWDGCFELIDKYAFKQQDKYFEGLTFERMVRESFHDILEYYRDGTVQPPYAVCLTLHNVQGYRIPDRYRPHIEPAPLEDDEVFLDPLVLSEIPQDEAAAAVAVRPLVDRIWNAFGYPKYYVPRI